MTGKDFFEELEVEVSRIGITQQNFLVFQEIKKSLSDFEIVDLFAQIKKNDKGEGLALETMLFDENVIHDIVFTRTTADYITIPLDKIKVIYLESSYKEETDETNASNLDKARLTISYGGELKLQYTTVAKRLSDLLRIKNNLIKTISK